MGYTYVYNDDSVNLSHEERWDTFIEKSRKLFTPTFRESPFQLIRYHAILDNDMYYGFLMNAVDFYEAEIPFGTNSSPVSRLVELALQCCREHHYREEEYRNAFSSLYHSLGTYKLCEILEEIFQNTGY